MKTSVNKIGLDAAKSEKLAEKLNSLLANYQVFYMNARGYHWNIKGDKFFELHAKFEELYTDLQVKIDELAERVLTLSHTPMHSYSDYLEHSKVNPAKNVDNGTKAVSEIVDSFQKIISQQRELLDLSDEAGDEGTNALMSDYIREQEKLVWMYNAYLG
ncbi:MAG: DNA starvation/stationary phase protection protein [Bacteroidales bacterium]|nr:DNA starvation/stationary phase protection protein [Bacteroidales bacterium]MBN2820551.1 DNA starvation/stationary phase protection protein [Bacteroidales bacterium]